MMRVKISSGILFALIVAGFAGLVVERNHLRHLQAEESRLKLLVGTLEVDDPDCMHIALVESSEPLHVLWRVYLPAGPAWRVSQEDASGGASWVRSGQSVARNELLRWRIVGSSDSFQSHVVSGSGSSMSSLDRKTTEFLREKWDRLNIQVAGEDVAENVSTDQIIALITIHVPPDLMAEVKEEFGERLWKRLKEHPLLKLELGSEPAFTTREKKLREQEGTP